MKNLIFLAGVVSALGLLMFSKAPAAKPDFTPAFEQKLACISRCEALKGVPEPTRLFCVCKFLYQ